MQHSLSLRTALALAAAQVSAAVAAPPSGSAYFTDPQHSQVEDATSKEIGLVNMILCFVSSMRPEALVNQGPYRAMVDENRCDSQRRSSSSGVDSEGAQAASYLVATVDSTRTSNDEPMRAKIWIEENDDRQESIFVNLSALRPPTQADPYGEFRLDFCGKGREMSPSRCALNGYLEGRNGGVDFYQQEDEEGRSHTTALRLATVGATSGSGRLQSDRSENGSEQSVTFDFAYDTDYFLRGEECFSRDASDPDTGFSVWRYGLYDATTGERIAHNSGFPIEYLADGQTYHGYIGYWGLSLPAAADALTTGTTVQRVDYGAGREPTKTDYTIEKAGGKLLKYTRHTRTLRQLDKIPFTTYVVDASQLFSGAVSGAQYEMYWDDVAGVFKVTGRVACGENACTTHALDQEHVVDASYWRVSGAIRGWSHGLGGELLIDLGALSGAIQSDQVSVAYRSQELVYPSQLPAALYCFSDCPTAATLARYFVHGTAPSPYEPAGAIVAYTFDAHGALHFAAGGPVVYTDREAYQRHPQYQWGVRSGRLVSDLDLAAVECSPGSGMYCQDKVDTLDVYYGWETGPNPWNQFAGVKASNGEYVLFDAPLQLTYQVSTAAAYGVYAGKTIVLQYGGHGDLWGIPGHCVSHLTNAEVSCDTQNARYVAAFAIPAGDEVTSGETTYLVKWLDREIRFAAKPAAECSAAGLAIASGSVSLPPAAGLDDPSDATSDIYLGAQPNVISAPRVIDGEIKY